MADDPSRTLAGGGDSPTGPRPRLAELVDFWIARIALAPWRLGRQIRAFSRWMEGSVFPEAQEAERVDSDLPPGTPMAERAVVIEVGADPSPLGSYERLRDLLADLGVRRLVLEAELEWNQISDVLQVLWCVRRPLRGQRPILFGRLLWRQKVVDALKSEDGLHVSCASVSFDPEQGQLSIRNSYCPLTFSRAATAYMQRTSRFHDHRAFFHAAPRYGVLAAAVTLLPTAAMLLLGRPPPGAVLVGVAVAAFVGIATVIVLETIGAIEYDKEHQARELARRHRELVMALNRIHGDLERARRIQRMFIPALEDDPFPEHVAVAHTFVPEMAVGGDYYDLRQIEGSRLALVFADVSGHGMSSAFITGIVKTAFELFELGSMPPREFAVVVNAMLDRFTPPDSFASLVVGIYDVPQRRFAYTNAGHYPVPMAVGPAPGQVDDLAEALGLVAGAAGDAFYEQSELALGPGRKLVLCTDGIIDSADADGDRFGVERLRRLLGENAGASADQIRDAIMAAVSEHCGSEPQNDDQAVLVLEVLK